MVSVAPRRSSTRTSWRFVPSPSASTDPRSSSDLLSGGCVLSVVGILYAVFLYAIGERGEVFAIALTGAVIGAAILGRCAWWRVREHARRSR